MTDKEFETRLGAIADLAHKQKSGAYTVESDAWMALNVVETLALLLLENYQATRMNYKPTKEAS